jgi:hypothetical protein
MKKEFTITGTCIPHLHYMVNIDHKVEKVIELIDKGSYFVISRPRQYGKTSMIYALEQKLSKVEYLIISISFEGLGDSIFQDIESFCTSIFEVMADGSLQVNEDEKERLKQHGKGLKTLAEVSRGISSYIQKVNKKVILIIDEVDRASNFTLFIHFLGMLRDKYLKRNSGKDTTFHSIILAGLHDIKNLKMKMHTNSEPFYNSPWNIATEFKVDMSFSAEEIETMLIDYNSTVGTEQALSLSLDQENRPILSKEIYKYTSGYPFLVSKICKVIEEEFNRDWTIGGIKNAINFILIEQNTLFDDIVKNIESYPDLYQLTNELLLNNSAIDFNPYNPVINHGLMYGIFGKHNNKLAISNKIFEVFLYNYLVTKLEISNRLKNRIHFVDHYLDSSGNLNMEHTLLKFQEFIKANYSHKDIEFYERHGRLLLIAFIKPIINGSGFYYIEPEHSYERRSDMIITYNKKEYILELKLWYGEKYHQEGLKQLATYLESRNHSVGYLVVFNFNKNKEFTNCWNEVEGKKIFEVKV